MKFKKYLFLLVFLLTIVCVNVSGKETKPSLLVYGSGIEAFIAAIQSARSNVPTMWIVNKNDFVSELTLNPTKITENKGLDGGIWKDLLMAMALSKEPNDSLASLVKQDINPILALTALEKMMAEEKKLTVLRGVSVQSLVATKSGWSVVLENRKKLDFRAVVDATADAELKSKVLKQHVDLADIELKRVLDVSQDESRTTVAVGGFENNYYSINLKDVEAQSVNNLFFIKDYMNRFQGIEGLPIRAHIAQAYGATAAYCAFFKTVTDKIDVRKLQTELLGFRARLLPWVDVSEQDPHYGAIEKLYLVSVLKSKDQDVAVLFNRQDSVLLEEVRPVFHQLYSRSQLWFNDHKHPYFTLADVLSLVKFVALRGDEVDAQVKKDWGKKLHFDSVYDLDRVVSRYEFATLVDRYADPYAKAVTKEGIIVR